MRKIFNIEEILEMPDDMCDALENEDQAKEEFDILMAEIFTFVWTYLKN